MQVQTVTKKQKPSATSPRSADNDFLTQLLPRLTQLSNVLNRGRTFELAVERAGVALERPAISVLGTLHVAREPLRIGDIATRMQVVGPHITRQVDGLVRRGMVRRVADPLDQRARLIELTTKGQAAIERYFQVIFGLFSEALVHWSTEDRQKLGQLLSRFVDDISKQFEALANETPETQD
jgi:DNA-binding MarR family transcriptional regulator